VVEAVSHAQFSEATVTLKLMWGSATSFLVMPGVDQIVTRAYLKTLSAEERWQTEALNPRYQGANLLFIEDAISNLPAEDSPYYSIALKQIAPERSIKYLLSLLSSEHGYTRFSYSLNVLQKLYNKRIYPEQILQGMTNTYVNKFYQLSWVERRELFKTISKIASSPPPLKPTLLISDLSRRVDTDSKTIELIKAFIYGTLTVLVVIFSLLVFNLLINMWDDILFWIKYGRVL
jgi:hypothetical protein